MARQLRNRTNGLMAVAVVVVVLVGSMGLFAAFAPRGGAPSASGAVAAPPLLHSAASPVTHGDLVVGPGQSYTISPTLAGSTYYQGGNITVDAGGTLIVKGVVLSFAQYVADSGTASQRLAHIYKFSVAGTVDFVNATVTTDVALVNAYAKLDLSVSGTLSSWNSVFAFPGWIDITGGGATATFNASTITWNPAVAALNEPVTILGDSLYAPTVSATGGATLNFFGTSVLHSYADDFSANGVPRPPALTAPGGSLATAGGKLNETVTGSSDSANLTLAYAYPSAGAESGYAGLVYSNPNSADATASVTVWYAGTGYALGSVTLVNGTTAATAEVPFSGALLSAISSGGMLGYLNTTGIYGGSPAEIAVQLTNTAGPTVTLSSLSFQFNTTGPSFDLSVSGTGSRLTAVDSYLDINWNPPPTGVYSQSPPFPWSSNKLTFTNGAVGYLANLSTTGGIPGVFSASAVQPDSSSQVYFYRWAEFNLTGRSGYLAVQGAVVSPFYAYSTNQSNNQTANSLNDLASADPALWGYVQYWDLQQGISQYGTSNPAGQAFVLLAAGNLTGPTLPDGIFLGSYHIGITVPSNGIGSHWFNWSVSPYPVGVANGTANFQGPDGGPPQSFSGYYAGMTFSANVTANGVLSPSATVSIGESLGLAIQANDTGTAEVQSVGAVLYYNVSGTGNPLASVVKSVALTTPGEFTSFNVSWVVNDSVTGLNGTFTHTFLVDYVWNGGNATRGGGIQAVDLQVTIHPSQIRIVSAATSAPGTLTSNGFYTASGVVQFNGTYQALVELVAVPTSGGSAVTLGSTYALPGTTFTIDWTSGNGGAGQLSPGTSYQLEVTATLNGVSAPGYFLPGTYGVPGPSTGPLGFLTQSYFGLPLWAWIAVAGAIVAGLLGFLLIARRQAAGKLVECGECGNLIPEDATVCPKCGAEFEADLIRCSRCAATIPANSKYCPECAAQLLGKPGEGGEEAERQGYADFTEKFRAEAKRELGENYSEGAFWDWWKRQPTYTPYGQWKLQQGQGTPRTGMTAPPAAAIAAPERTAPAPAARRAAAAPAYVEPTAAPAAPPSAAPPTGAGQLKPCPNCGKEIPPEYLVCPFCGAVTQ